MNKVILEQEAVAPPAEYDPAGQAEQDAEALSKQKLAAQLVHVVAEVHVAHDEAQSN